MKFPDARVCCLQAVNEALSSVDDGVTARAIENRLLEEQAAQLCRVAIDRFTSLKSLIANELLKISLNSAHKFLQKIQPVAVRLYLVLDQINRPDFAILTNESGRHKNARNFLVTRWHRMSPAVGFEARAELARRQQAESELNAQAVSFYKTAEVRTPDEVAPLSLIKYCNRQNKK